MGTTSSPQESRICGIATGRDDTAWLPGSFVHGWIAIDPRAIAEDKASTTLEDESDRH
jgi:hypothetical protein